MVPHYIIENDEDNELLKAQQFNQWKQTGFERVKKAALKVILRNDYKDYEDALRQMKLQSLEKEGSEQSMVCKKQTLQIWKIEICDECEKSSQISHK